MAKQFNIRGVPTLIYIGKDGQKKDETVGVVTAEVINDKLKALIQ
jgi:thiol:disulfide interchange protein